MVKEEGDGTEVKATCKAYLMAKVTWENVCVWVCKEVGLTEIKSTCKACFMAKVIWKNVCVYVCGCAKR